MERNYSKYMVAKTVDVEKYLTPLEGEILCQLLHKVHVGRVNEGKPTLELVCVDKRWPMYEAVWDAISTWVDTEEGVENCTLPLEVHSPDYYLGQASLIKQLCGVAKIKGQATRTQLNGAISKLIEIKNQAFVMIAGSSLSGVSQGNTLCDTTRIGKLDDLITDYHEGRVQLTAQDGKMVMIEDSVTTVVD